MVLAQRTAKGSMILGVLLLVAGCATIDGRSVYNLRVPPSHGDGEFSDTSWRYPWPSCPFGMAVLGYNVRFPAFDLGEAYNHEFVVEDLHEIGPKVGVYLFVDGPVPTDAEQHQLHAEFAFEVRDSSGQLIAHLNKPIGELTWTTPAHIDGGGDGAGLYSLDESFFKVHRTERYTLRVRYRPDPALRGRRGLVYLNCGGSI